MKIQRSSGVLLHPTSLPGPQGVGSLGREARQFVECLARAHQRWWQILPLNPPGYGGSPYSAISAFAGNPVLVDLEALVERGWLTPVEFGDFVRQCENFPHDRYAIAEVTEAKSALLRRAFERWEADDAGTRPAFEAFVAREAGWLDDFALFVAIKAERGGKPWYEWPKGLVRREKRALTAARARLARPIQEARFAQWLFFEQWGALRAYAAERGVRFIGDIPIFVSMDSADAWAARKMFEIDAEGRAEAVAGVPPDYFSETGQRWGNPLYDWKVVARDGYRWWIARVEKVLETVDLVRIDHFRGFAAYWRVPAEAPTAIDGTWVEGPGDAFFDAIRGALGEVPFIAEDLGLITDDVLELRDRQGLPGMKVVQFAFDGEPDHPFLPHTYPQHAVAYSGTHDNDTTRGWFDALDEMARHHVRVYFQSPNERITRAIVERLEASRADLVVVPVQDLFDLGTDARMNTPGVGEGNWQWRMSPEMLAAGEVWQWLGRLTRTHGRG